MQNEENIKIDNMVHVSNECSFHRAFILVLMLVILYFIFFGNIHAEGI
jgi:hypothetical protein